MSKSYENTIPLFLPENQLKKLVRRIPTDSTPVEAPKDPDSSAVFQLLEQFATTEVAADVRKRLEAGGVAEGAEKARARASSVLKSVRSAIGIGT